MVKSNHFKDKWYWQLENCSAFLRFGDGTCTGYLSWQNGARGCPYVWSRQKAIEVCTALLPSEPVLVPWNAMPNIPPSHRLFARLRKPLLRLPLLFLQLSLSTRLTFWFAKCGMAPTSYLRPLVRLLWSIRPLTIFPCCSGSSKAWLTSLKTDSTLPLRSWPEKSCTLIGTNIPAVWLAPCELTPSILLHAQKGATFSVPQGDT